MKRSVFPRKVKKAMIKKFGRVIYKIYKTEEKLINIGGYYEDWVKWYFASV